MTVPPTGIAPAGGKIYLPAISAPNSRLGQGRKPAAQNLRCWNQKKAPNLIKIKPKYIEAQHMKPPFDDDFAC